VSALDDALLAADGVADAFLEGKHIPGVAYGVVVGGELVHSRGLGTLRLGEDATPDADSVFRIASMTKSFTAATVLSLRDEGRLGLDEPIATYVPELAALPLPTADSRALTIRQLLTMSSGLATDDPWGDRQQGLDLAAFAELLRGPLTFAWPPGTRFEYSNLGYGILGRLITNVGGAEYRDVVRERILAPLGMTASTYLEEEVPAERLAHGYIWRDDGYLEEPLDRYGALASMGGLFTSVRDLARWVAFFTDAFPPRDDPEGEAPLSRATRREMQQVHNAWPPEVELPGLDAAAAATGGGYGYGLYALDDTRWGRSMGHSGGYPGFGSNMRWLTSSGLGVITLANHRYAPAGLLAFRILTSILGSGAVPARPIRPSKPLAAARAAVERLVAAWDDDAATRLFAMNVELDEPLARRRAALDRIRDVHGPLRADPELPEEADTQQHATWWLAGEKGGRVKLEIRLSPEPAPLVQTFDVTSVPEPNATLAKVAGRIVRAVNGRTPALPTTLKLGAAVDRAAVDRVLRIAGARFAPISLGPAVGGDGAASATWRIRSERGELELAIDLDASSGELTSLALSERPATPRNLAD
jgi:CubicO group peptidase (beta-lactamase class C family)